MTANTKIYRLTEIGGLGMETRITLVRDGMGCKGGGGGLKVTLFVP